MGAGRCWVEQLEGRRFLSGSVSTTFEDGLLRIAGDDAANVVYVQRDYEDPDPSALEVHGRDETLINGVTQRGPFRFSGVRAIEVAMNDGDDEIHFVGLRLQDGLNIDGGAGDDAVYIRRSRILGNTVVRSGHSADVLTVADTFFGNDLIVDGRTGRAPPSVAFRPRPFGFTVLPFGFAQWSADTRGPTSVSLRDSVFSDNLSITTGLANDRLTMNNCSVDGFSHLAMGDGDDFVSIADSTHFSQSTTLDDGPGDDHVYREVWKLFDFNRGPLGWRPHFADYRPAPDAPADLTDVPAPIPESASTFRSEITPLPPELKGDRRGYRLFGTNRSDDLFVFLSRQLSQTDGLLPNQRYQIIFTITVATNNHPLALGPHELLVVGSLSRPTEVRFLPDSGARLIGNDGSTRAQPANGDATVIFEEIKKTDASLDRFLDYETITLLRTHKTGATNAGANLWLFAGVDSGSERDVEYYLERVEVRLLPVT